MLKRMKTNYFNFYAGKKCIFARIPSPKDNKKISIIQMFINKILFL